MKVRKFGGSCLKNKSSIELVLNLIKHHDTEQIIVISAIYGVTDKINALLELRATSEEKIQEQLVVLGKIHYELTEQLITSPSLLKETTIKFEEKFKKLERLLYGVLYTGELSPTLKTLILSYGERFSALILEGALKARNIEAKSIDADEIPLLTDDSIDNATADMVSVRKGLSEKIIPLVKDNIIPVITGFFGCNKNKKITTFGRNSSDYSAAVIGAGINAMEIEIWKDVDGFLSSDPMLVPNTHLIDRLSYYEAAELSYLGARILHPRTVEPLLESEIPIKIKNIYNPKKEGTLICANGYMAHDVIKSVTYNKEISVLKIQGAGVGYKPGIISEIGYRLLSAGINIYSIITSQTCINLLLNRKDTKNALVSLHDLQGGVIEKIEPLENLVLVAVVGEGMISTHGLAAKVMGAVAEQRVNVEMMSMGASDVAYYFIVQEKDLSKTVASVHNSFFVKT